MFDNLIFFPLDVRNDFFKYICKNLLGINQIFLGKIVWFDVVGDRG